MKLNLLLIITMTMVLLSCDTETEENETVYIYAQQVYYASAIAEENDLKQRQDEITLELETNSTNEQLLNEFENNTQRITRLQNLSEVLIGLNPSIGPIGPIPMPPDGCFDTSIGLNCAPQQNLTNTDIMVLHEDINILNISLFNNEIGDTVGFESVPGDQFSNQEVLLFDANFANITIMHSTISVDGIGEITINTPIVVN